MPGHAKATGGPGGGPADAPAVVAAGAAGDRRQTSMLFGEIIAVALGALRANKLRSHAHDARHRDRRGRGDRDGRARQRRAAAVKDRIKALGTTLLTVKPGQQRTGGGSPPRPIARS